MQETPIWQTKRPVMNISQMRAHRNLTIAVSKALKQVHPTLKWGLVDLKTYTPLQFVLIDTTARQKQTRNCSREVCNIFVLETP